MKEHVRILGILWIVYGGLSLLVSLFVFALFFGITLIPGVELEAVGILRLIGLIAGSFFGVLGLPKIIGGIGLLHGREWGRILVIILSFFSLLNVPVGMALGIYSLIVLFNRETVEYFSGNPQA